MYLDIVNVNKTLSIWNPLVSLSLPTLMSAYISTILHCSGKNPESSLWLALPPTLTHYNQGGTKNTTPNLERRNGMGSLSVLSFCQHVKIPEKNILWKWTLIKQSSHGTVVIWQSRLLTLWKSGSKQKKMWKWPGTTYTLQKPTCPRSPSFNLAPLPDCSSTGLQVCFRGRAIS